MYYMALFNYAAKEITLKIVYYGPGFSGKTTSLQYLHTMLPSGAKGKLISMATEGDRTIFFDFLPIDIGKIRDFNIRFQMYTVPGQVRYNATRRLVLKGADAIIFVADSQREMDEQNVESLTNMQENLAANNITPDIPKVFQYNKRDIENIMSVDELNSALNKEENPFFETVAAEGKGVVPAFEMITKNVLEYIKTKHNVDIEVPVNSIIPDEATPSKPSAEERVHLKDSRTTPSVGRPAPNVVRKPTAGDAIESEIIQKSATQTITAMSADAPSPSLSELSELISAIKALNNSVADISKGLRGIQVNQVKNTEALTDLKQMLLKGRGGLFKRFFR